LEIAGIARTLVQVTPEDNYGISSGLPDLVKGRAKEWFAWRQEVTRQGRDRERGIAISAVQVKEGACFLQLFPGPRVFQIRIPQPMVAYGNNKRPSGD